jgi:hypothetical protein
MQPVAIEPGRVRIGRRTLRARDIEGASTARTLAGIAVTLRPKGAQPISYVVRDEKAADAMLAALGVGHSGIGRLEWLLVRREYARTTLFLDFFVALAFALSLVMYDDPFLSTTVFVLGGVPMLASVLWRTQWKIGARVLAFDLWGVWVANVLVPWSEIRGAKMHARGLELALDARSAVVEIPPHSMSDEEKLIVLDQLRGAIARAHGQGRQKAEPNTRVDILARQDEDARHWLARIDAITADLGNATYRGATIDPNDLWLTLEDPDAPPDLRAASARVLARIAPEKKVRIDGVIAAARTTETEEQLRISMEPDIETAASKLERIG